MKDKMLANGLDAKVFQDKDAVAQRWHLYERMNDLFILLHNDTKQTDKRVMKCHKRFLRIEKVGVGVTVIVLISMGVLIGLGILGWDEIKPVIAAINKVPLL